MFFKNIIIIFFKKLDIYIVIVEFKQCEVFGRRNNKKKLYLRVDIQFKIIQLNKINDFCNDLLLRIKNIEFVD